MIHEIENGDRIKILPFVNEHGKIYWGKSYDIARIGGYTIYDDTGNLSKMRFLHNNRVMDSNTYRPVNITRRYFFHIYVNGESKLVYFGRTLYKLVEKMTLDVKNNQHILVRKKDKNTTHGFPLISYEDSNILNCEWDPPVSDINSSKEWFDWLKANSPSLSIYDNMCLSNNRDKLIEFFGTDLYSEVISEERNKKIEKILK